MISAKFQHDCQECVFLGHEAGFDHYYCGEDGDETIIARDGDEGPDYISGVVFRDVHPLNFTASLAVKAGLLRK